MKVVFISDTHGLHKQLSLPQGDLLIHAGDITGRGTKEEVEDFLNWFSAQKFKYKIFIAGNHDFFIEDESLEFRSMIPNDCIYLEDRYVEVEGLKIYGSPWTPQFMDWAFMRPRAVMNSVWDGIPEGLDVLITHGPAYGIQDKIFSGENVGCEHLLKLVESKKPKHFLFGHIHEGYGESVHQNVLFKNGAVLNEHYQLVNDPIVFHI